MKMRNIAAAAMAGALAVSLAACGSSASTGAANATGEAADAALRSVRRSDHRLVQGHSDSQ